MTYGVLNKAGTLAPFALFTVLWLGCLSWSAPRIEAHLHGQAAAAIAHTPEASVQIRGRSVTLHGANITNGDAALLAKRLRGVPGIDQVTVASTARSI